MHVVVVFYVQSHEYRIAESLVVGMKKARISSVGRAVRGEIGDLLGFASGRMTWDSVEGNEMLTISRVVLRRGRSGKFADNKTKRGSLTVTALRKAFFREIWRSDLLERSFVFSWNAKRWQKPNDESLFLCFSENLELCLRCHAIRL